MVDLYFGGSMWCNVDIALRRIDSVFKQETETLGLTVIEWYILRFLYEQDGQMPSHLAERVGRAPTSFTPIIDAIERKGFIERRPNASDRRSVKIHLTAQGKILEKQIAVSAKRLETNFRQMFSDNEWQSYQRVIEIFQHLRQ